MWWLQNLYKSCSHSRKKKNKFFPSISKKYWHKTCVEKKPWITFDSILLFSLHLVSAKYYDIVSSFLLIFPMPNSSFCLSNKSGEKQMPLFGCAHDSSKHSHPISAIIGPSRVLQREVTYYPLLSWALTYLCSAEYRNFLEKKINTTPSFCLNST